MTDLLSRPSRSGAAAGSSRDLRPAPRPLTTNALLAGGLAALVTLVLCMSVALTGWFLADAGAHGDTTDALRVGADAWLVGNGSHLVFAGVPIGIVPLALTALMLVATFRAGRWAGRVSAPPSPGAGEHPWALAATMLAGVYALVAVITCVLSSLDSAAPSLGRAIVVPAVLAFVGGGLGLAVGGDRLEGWLGRLPGWLRHTGYGAVTGALGVVVAAAVVLAVSLLLHLNEAATVISGLHLGVGDALTYAVVIALVAPNCVLLTASYLVGPGFAFGTGTVVSPTGVSLGVVPAFPVLAAVPGEGPAPTWMLAFMALPVLSGAVGAAVAQRRSDSTSFDLASLRGALAGFAAGVLVAVAVALAGGPLGTGRMADIGAPFFEVLVIAGGGMGVGGMFGGLAMAWWQRHRAGADSSGDGPGDDSGDGPGDGPTDDPGDEPEDGAQDDPDEDGPQVDPEEDGPEDVLGHSPDSGPERDTDRGTDRGADSEPTQPVRSSRWRGRSAR